MLNQCKISKIGHNYSYSLSFFFNTLILGSCSNPRGHHQLQRSDQFLWEVWQMATRPVGVLSYGPCKGQVGRVAKLLPPSQWQGTRKGTRKGVEIDEQWGFKWPKWGYATQKVAVSSWKWQNLVFYRMCQILPQSHTTRQTKHQNLNVKRLEHGWTWKIPWKDLWKMFLLLLMGVCHGCGVEALQVDPDLVTYSAAVSSCEKAVRWKLALFLGWNLPFFLNRNSMDDLNGRYIYIYIFLSDLSDLITKCTVGIHNPYMKLNIQSDQIYMHFVQQQIRISLSFIPQMYCLMLPFPNGVWGVREPRFFRPLLSRFQVPFGNHAAEQLKIQARRSKILTAKCACFFFR